MQLKDRNIPCCICTNSSSGRIKEGLEPLQIDMYFDSIYSGYETGHNKPDPFIYLQSMTDHHINAEKTIIFEDSGVGILGAKKSQAHVIALREPDHLMNQSKADRIIDSL